MNRRVGREKDKRQAIRWIAVNVCLSLCFLIPGPAVSFAEGGPYAAFNPETAYRIPEKPALETEPAVPVKPANEEVTLPKGSWDVLSSPLSQADAQNSAEPSKKPLTDQERENIKLLLAELCATVRCSDTNGTSDFIDTINKELSGHTTANVNNPAGANDYEQMLKDILSSLKTTNAPSGQATVQQTVNALQHGNSGGQSVWDRLRALRSQLLSSSTMGNGLPAYTSYRPGVSKEIAQSVVSGLQTTEAYVRDTIDHLKENVRAEGFREEVEKSMAMDQALVAAAQADPFGGIGQGPSGRYRVLQGVTLDSQIAAMHLLMNPPERLHPFTRWYFYKKYMTQERLKQYEKAREKVLTIYLLAKEGKGLIRYKGRIGPVYLPFMNEKGGSYELVQRS